ncbi:MAG TPA: intradiol ring-cleavage dioxygenase [Candidatus Tumulicola sp.]
MRDIDEDSITDAVLRSLHGTEDERARFISEALVRHLHAFISEVRPTQTEWEAGIAFLTATGQMCSETRQEFILLSDVLGVSTLVDAINNRFAVHATQSTVLGPFYVAPPSFENGDDVRGHLTGVPLFISGTVSGSQGKRIRDASIDVWHSDEAGFYDLQLLSEDSGLAGRGRFRSDSDGRFWLWTVRPSPYPIPDDGPVGKMLAAQGRHPFRPEHVHFIISAPGYKRLVTHIFADGDQYLDSDVVFGVKQSLIRTFETRDGGTAPDCRSMAGPWFTLHYDFVLEPE